MAKKTFKLKCDDSRATANAASVRLVSEAPATPAAPGQPPVRNFKTIFQLNFSKADAGLFKDFDPGKEYTVTIEESK